jgi:integrase
MDCVGRPRRQVGCAALPTLRHGRLAETLQPLEQNNVHRMIQRRAGAGLRTKISAHSFRATGITNYLQNGGKLEVAQAMAGHESARTTGLKSGALLLGGQGLVALILLS